MIRIIKVQLYFRIKPYYKESIVDEDFKFFHFLF